MLVRDKKSFALGFIMFIIFIGILIVMSCPFFEGRDAFEAADNLFNSIAKGSSYKIPTLKIKANKFEGTEVNWVINLNNIFAPELTKKILTTAEAQVSSENGNLKIKGDLGEIASMALKDAESMYFDKEKEISEKYGTSGKSALFAWWKVLKEGKDILKREKKVDQSSFIEHVVKKAIEPAYNFYGITPEKASSKIGTIIFLLIFYVAYTVWWGFSLFFLFQGLGFVLEAGEKEEM